jgi:hypothetical protein
MKAIACAVVIAAALVTPALAAPGDPRMIQGTLEWPVSVDKEPFVVVRGADGALYYTHIGAAQRRGSPSAGAAVTVLGVEGSHAHEIVAMLLAVNENAAGARAAAPVATAPAATAAPTAPAPAAPPSAPAATAAPAAAKRTAARSPFTAPPAPAQALSTSPLAEVSGSAPAADAATEPPGVSLVVGTTRRGTQVHGVVVSFADRMLVLRADDGERVMVDVSDLSPNFGRMVNIGADVKFYGRALEQSFKANGFIETVGGRR